jgi:hypothetical protein
MPAGPRPHARLGTDQESRPDTQAIERVIRKIPTDLPGLRDRINRRRTQ